MMYIIMGRTASGKDHFAELLKQQGLTGVKSHTTRPKRFEEEDTHVFISKDEADKITDRVAYTKIGDYEYFATTDDITGKDFYIIDPIGLVSLANNMPDMTFCVIYIEAAKQDRKRHFVARQSCSKEEAEKLFDERDRDENEQFNEFEAKLHAVIKDGDGNMADMALPENIHSVHTFQNLFEMAPEGIVAEANATISQKKCHQILTQMTLEAIELGIIIANENKQIAVRRKDNPDLPTYVNPEMFANILIGDTKELGTFMREYIGRSNRLEIKPEA